MRYVYHGQYIVYARIYLFIFIALHHEIADRLID